MYRKRRLIVLIPPKGTRVRSFRIRVSFIVVLFFVLLGGFAGYLIPFNHLTLDITEQNQRKNLSDQNAKLIQKIRAIRQSLFALRARIQQLSEKRDELARPLDLQSPKRSRDNPERPPTFTTPQIIERIGHEESLLVRFFEMHGSDTSFFQRVPVLRPLAGYNVVTNRFGRVIDVFTGTEKQHTGIDMAAQRDTPVLATASGVVTRSENHPLWGLRVLVEHENGFSTVYAHLGSVSVAPGKKLRRGSVIGTVGSSGLSTGPHLHYEIQRKGVPVDPEEYFFPEAPVLAASVAR